ncbi:MAG: hypothetical protein IBJ15_00125 [Alphaproteobacteria bacterium]|nr:hypothetical protein [Alphaproteobacteria bacterium]
MLDWDGAPTGETGTPLRARLWRATELVGHFALLAAFVCGALFLHPLSWLFAVASTLLAGVAEFRLGRCHDLTERTPPATRTRALGALAAAFAGTAAAFDGASADGIVGFQICLWIASAFGGWLRFADIAHACRILERRTAGAASAPSAVRRDASAIGDA